MEAGGYGSSFFDIPIFLALLQRTRYDWQFTTVPQKNACLGLKNRQSFWPTGKIFGGTHKFNNMIFHKGHVLDYKDLIELNYFEETEIIPIQKTEYHTNIAEDFIEAAHDLGFEGLSNGFSHQNLKIKS